MSKVTNEALLLIKCVHQERFKDTHCNYTDKPCMSAKHCTDFIPQAFTKAQTALMLNYLYEKYKCIDSKNLEQFRMFAGHDAIDVNDIYDLEYQMDAYILLRRKSKYSRRKYISNKEYIHTINILRQYRFKITKAMWRKFNRLSRKPELLR